MENDKWFREEEGKEQQVVKNSIFTYDSGQKGRQVIFKKELQDKERERRKLTTTEGMHDIQKQEVQNLSLSDRSLTCRLQFGIKQEKIVYVDTQDMPSTSSLIRSKSCSKSKRIVVRTRISHLFVLHTDYSCSSFFDEKERERERDLISLMPGVKLTVNSEEQESRQETAEPESEPDHHHHHLLSEDVVS